MYNNENEPTIKDLKKSLDIIEVAKIYGEVIRSGAKNSYKYKNDTSITFNADKQYFTNWNGDTEKGLSVLDLIMYMEKIELSEAIKKMKELSNLDTYVSNPKLQEKRKKAETKKINLIDLARFANNNLKQGKIVQPIVKLILPKNEEDEEIHYDELILKEEFTKLFETTKFPKSLEPKLNYIFRNLVGFDNFWKCPSIIIRDSKDTIVDYISYRPRKPKNFSNWSEQKYIVKNSTRGSDFLYPFKKEVEKILDKKEFLVIGEGIKNGLNALLYSVPFVSVESASTNINPNLIKYIKDFESRKYSIISMFDGDLAGAQAYLNFIKKYFEETKDIINNFIKLKENIVLPDKSNKDIVLKNFITFIKDKDYQIKNYFEFNSNIDFVEYLQNEES